MFTLEALVPKTPDSQPFLAKIKQIVEEKDVVKQYNILISIISFIHELSKNLESRDS